MEEDEDQFLLSSLGVTSANPEDLEQTILDEVIFAHSFYVFGSSVALLILLKGLELYEIWI